MSTLVCSPPTPCLRRPRLRFPLPVAYLVASACSVPGSRRHVRSPTCHASETGHRLSARPGWVLRRGEGLPGAWTVLFVRAMVEHPAGDTPLLAQTTHMQRGVVAFRENRTLGLREDDRFRGRMPHGPHVRIPTHRRCHF